jgi:hypothetical protein
MNKQIGSARDMSNGTVQVFDSKGCFLFQLQGRLVGYTGSTVTVVSSSGCHQTYGVRGEFLYQR